MGGACHITARLRLPLTWSRGLSYVFCSLEIGCLTSGPLVGESQRFVKKRLSSAAAPREIEVVPSLPKTRSGKIMRRLLEVEELGLPLGDTSTLEDD